MKPVVWTFPYWIDDFPGMGSLIMDAGHIRGLMVLYFGIWAIVAKLLYIPKENGQPILEGFIISTVLMLVYYYWLSLPYSLSFDKPGKQLVASTAGKWSRSYTGGGKEYRVLYKSPWQDKYGKKEKKIGESAKDWKIGVVVDAEKYNKYKKEGRIEDATLEDLAYRKRHLRGTDKVQADTPFDTMVSVSFYLLIVLYSAAIIIAKVNRKIFGMLYPWIILSTLFLLIQSGVWLANPTAEKSVLTFIIKRQLFILGLSFALTGVLIVLKLNNR